MVVLVQQHPLAGATPQESAPEPPPPAPKSRELVQAPQAERPEEARVCDRLLLHPGPTDQPPGRLGNHPVHLIANGQLATLTDPFGSVLSYGYDAAGRKASRLLPAAGLVSTWTYDAAGRVKKLETLRATQNVAKAELGHDALGNVTSKDQDIAGLPGTENGTWSYEYDQASRLTKAVPPSPSGGALQYTYDGAGNRTSVKTGGAPAVVTHYDAAGNPDDATDGTDYETDATGALTKITRPGSVGGLTGTTRYSYDTWGRLTQAQIIPNPAVPPALPETVGYSYDALDRMTTRNAGPLSSVTYRYAGQTQDVVKETTSEGLPLESSVLYSHSPEGPLASKTGGVTAWFATDTHGDVVAQVSPSATTGSRGYSPWGEKRATSGTAPGPFGFQGDWTDPSTKLVDMGARLYAGDMGRFTTMDPLEGSMQNPMSLNDFIYTEGNPLSFADPTGLTKAGASDPAPGRSRAERNDGVGNSQENGCADALSCGASQPYSPPFQPSRVIIENAVPILPQYGKVRGGAFIGACSVDVPGWGQNLQGDCRKDGGFDAFASVEDFRIFFLIDYTSGRIIVRTNHSCYAGGVSCRNARPLVVYSPPSRENPLGTPHWNVRTERSSSFSNGVNLAIRARNSVTAGPNIDIAIAVQPLPGSNNVRGLWWRDGYPSFEAYQRIGTLSRILVQRPGTSPTSLFGGYDESGYFS